MQNSSPILARQWWRHFRLFLSLSLSLCISLSLSHRMYLTHNIGSASALPIIQRERELERERERRKWRHHCRAKIGDEFCTSPHQKVHLSLVLAKSFALFFNLPKKLASHFLPSCFDGAEFTLSVAKNIAPFETVRILRTVKWRDWQGIEAAKQTIEFPAAPFYFLVEKIEKMNQINTKNYWK